MLNLVKGGMEVLRSLENEVCGMGTLVIEKKSNNNKHHAINIRHKWQRSF